MNLAKPTSLFQTGLRPLLFSKTEARVRGSGWVRGGFDITYQKSQRFIHRGNTEQLQDRSVKHKCYYVLSFSIILPHDNDLVYVAHSPPYTYTDLQRYLMKIENDPSRSIFVQRERLCVTLAGSIMFPITFFLSLLLSYCL